MCNRCQEVGHLRKTNKLCGHCVPRSTPKSKSTCPSKTNIAVKDPEEDSEEQASLDSISFDAPGELTAGHLEATVESLKVDIDDKEEQEEEPQKKQ